MNPTPRENINPNRLGLFVNLGIILASLLASIQDGTGVLPLEKSLAFDVSLLGLYFFALWQRIRHRPRLSLSILHLGLLGYSLAYVNYSLTSPSQAFLLLNIVGLTSILAFHFDLHDDVHLPPKIFSHRLLLSSSLGISCNWLYLFLFSPTTEPFALYSMLLGSAIILGVMILHFTFVPAMDRWRLGFMFGLVLIVLAVRYVSQPEPSLLSLAQASGLLPLAGLILSLPTRQIRDRINAAIEAVFFNPEGSILSTFLALCIVGSLLLALPMSVTHAKGISFIDAAFTAVSAVCVTGLTVLDSAKDFTLIGQIIILLLIQAGGLGIMSLSSLALLIIGKRVSIRQESALMSVLGQRLKGEIRYVLKHVLLLTISLEALGTAILTIAFRPHEGQWSQAFWQGLFTSISAFCNAGFALYSQNLIPFQDNHVVILTVTTLIILGGLSPTYILALPQFRKNVTLSVQFRMVTLCTAFLLVSGTLMIAAFEWNQSLSTLSPLSKLSNAWFQSVTTRTAGFNTIDMLRLTPATQMIMMVLMFIGGSPGGTAGGIKTTTFMLALFAAKSVFNRTSEVEAFGRRIPYPVVLKAFALILLALGIILFAFVALLLTQELSPFHLLFEVVSALGTVGLSLGITPQLNTIGKFLILCCMYIGRVGPLTVAMFLAHSDVLKSWILPEEEVNVG